MVALAGWKLERRRKRQHRLVKPREELVHERVVIAQVIVETYEFVAVGTDAVESFDGACECARG